MYFDLFVGEEKLFLGFRVLEWVMVVKCVLFEESFFDEFVSSNIDLILINFKSVI